MVVVVFLVLSKKKTYILGKRKGTVKKKKDVCHDYILMFTKVMRHENGKKFSPPKKVKYFSV